MAVQHLAADGSGALLNGWVYAGENPILRFEPDGMGGHTVNYYREDASDSVAALLNAGGAVVAEYEYDAFGNSLNGVNPTSAAGGDFGYHGAWRDAETGLYHMRARTYDPQTGRFTTPDPATPNPQVPETYELYSFANNNPHLYSDPTGLFSLTEINISISVSDVAQGAKNVAVHEAKQFLKDQISEFGVQLLVNVLKGFIPGGQFLSELGSIEDFSEQGKRFDQLLKGQLYKIFYPLKDLPLASQFWLDPQVDRFTGEAQTAGINIGKPEESSVKVNNRHPRPDFIVRDGSPLDYSLKSYVIGDIKRSVATVYHEVRKKESQYQAIQNHAINQGLRVGLYIALTRGTRTDAIGDWYKQFIGKEAIRDGFILVTVQLLNTR